MHNLSLGLISLGVTLYIYIRNFVTRGIYICRCRCRCRAVAMLLPMATDIRWTAGLAVELGKV